MNCPDSWVSVIKQKKVAYFSTAVPKGLITYLDIHRSEFLIAHLYVILRTGLQCLMSQCNTPVPWNRLNITQFLPFWAHFLSFEGSLRDPWRSESPIVQFIFPDRSCSWPIILWNPRGPQNRKKCSFHTIFWAIMSPWEPLRGFRGPNYPLSICASF